MPLDSPAARQLNPRVLRALASLGYERLLPIQEKAIPVILSGSHTLIVSPTGSGKTEAAVLPVLSMMADRFQPGDGLVKAIYITPLRALNRDIAIRVQRLVEAVGFSAALRHGDSTASVRRKFLHSPPDFMVTTPETLNLLLTLRDRRDMWRGVGFVIVDELQELIDNKRGAELSVVLERLERASGLRVQRIGLSATLSERSKRAAAELLAYGRRVSVVEDQGNRKYRIEVVPVGYTAEDYFTQAVKKIAEIVRSTDGSVLVFTNTRSVAEKLGSLLSKELGDEVMVHHGSLSREERERAERMFREGKLKVLVATSSMELGIDIGSVRRVVQFMSPREVIAMTQRAGRADHRYGGTSEASIVTFDNVFELLESAVIARRAERGELEDLGYPRGSLDVLAHQMAAMVVEGTAESPKDVLDVVSSSAALSGVQLEQVTKVAAHLSDVRVLKYDDASDRLGMSRRTMKYLYGVSMIPDEATYRVYDVASGSQIGEVSERFVEAAALRGEGEPFRFVLAGKVWEAVNIDYDELRVDAKPVALAEGAVPTWEGELIPVSYKVAREVCGVLSMATVDPEAAAAMLRSRGLSGGPAEKVIKVAGESARLWGSPFTPAEPIIEEFRGLSVLYACLGSKGNLLLGLVLSKLMEPVEKAWFDYIPYALVFSSHRGVPGSLVKEALLRAKSLEPPEILTLAYDAVRNTPLYVIRFLQVAKRMGVIEPDARVSIEQGKKIVEAYRGSVVDSETLREIAFDKLELEPVVEFLRSLKEPRVVKLSEPSPLAKEVMENPYLRRELAVNIKEVALDYIVESLRRSALSRDVLLLCAHCGYSWREEASRAASGVVRCPKCGAITVAPLPSSQWGEQVVQAFLKWRRSHQAKLSREEKEMVKEVIERAKLYTSYASQGLGRYVIEALMNRGVGPRAVKRVMEAYMTRGERAFYEELLKAKEEYVAYSRYWAEKRREGAQEH